MQIVALEGDADKDIEMMRVNLKKEKKLCC